ncbi:UNVERIFIED_CONTAM: hypothetical protein Sradi_5852000 [Sesamum radiatum]|uniref:Retrotransposon gag domain-containing protein n=1 Tax=Sesamum radiatum TaxID=300843 RepID=A0AAW2KTA5_SESRA
MASEGDQVAMNEKYSVYTFRNVYCYIICSTIARDDHKHHQNPLRRTTQSSPTYSKPYNKRVDSLKMPIGYQPPELRQFDGKGNPRQHITHFIEICNNVGTDGDLLVEQFVRSLKKNAFGWYIDLESESINGWDEIEKKFLNRFYSTRRTVSMVELANTRQWKNEPIIDYINHWHALSLNCKDKLSETSAIEMCIQGMHWDLVYILQGISQENLKSWLPVSMTWS